MADAKNKLFETADEFREAADKYFDECDEKGEFYSQAGLQLGLKKYGPKHRFVDRNRLSLWANGEGCVTTPGLQEAVLEAFARIEHQIETDSRYQDKALNTRAIFYLKQPMLGGMQDVQKENKTKVEVVLKHGKTVEESDFQ